MSNKKDDVTLVVIEKAGSDKANTGPEPGKFESVLVRWVHADCDTCKNKSQTLGARCVAYPDGIPQSILLGEVSHKTPYEGDGGIMYEPIES